MTAAVVFLWASCLWSIARSVLCLLLTASLRRRLLILAILALTVSSLRTPHAKSKSP